MYWNNLKYVKQKIGCLISNIFKSYNNELCLKVEDYNLLEDTANCIESSTSIGFIIEEFIVAKLINSTNSKLQEDGIKILRDEVPTINSSYDCYTIYKDIF